MLFGVYYMRYGELKKVLSENGCYFIRHGGDHDMWYSPITNKKFPVPRHDSHEAALPTLRKIKRQSGI